MWRRHESVLCLRTCSSSRLILRGSSRFYTRCARQLSHIKIHSRSPMVRKCHNPNQQAKKCFSNSQHRSTNNRRSLRSKKRVLNNQNKPSKKTQVKLPTSQNSRNSSRTTTVKYNINRSSPSSKRMIKAGKCPLIRNSLRKPSHQVTSTKIVISLLTLVTKMSSLER